MAPTDHSIARSGSSFQRTINERPCVYRVFTYLHRVINTQHKNFYYLYLFMYDCKTVVFIMIYSSIALAVAVIEFNDRGRSVTPTFLFRNRFNLQLSPPCPKMNKKSMWEVTKIPRFLSTGHRTRILPSCGCKASETVVAKGELVL